jgi:hypothetical protein
MDGNSCVIYTGSVYTLEWYYDKNGNSIAYDYFLKARKGFGFKIKAGLF